MDAKPKRPISVWITQVFLVIYGVLFTAASIGDLSYIEASDPQPWLLFSVISGSVIGLLMFAAFIGVVVRWKGSRWLVITSLSFAFVFFVLSVINASLIDDPETGVPSDPFELIGYLGAFSLFTFPLLLLGLIFVFDGKVGRFYNPPPESEVLASPPPPTFES